jgi:phosphohistidine phosphatase SixA
MRARRSADTVPVRWLLRHADAGVRADWHGNDEWRGLSPLGWDQAEEVAARLDGLPVHRVLSSPSLRCRQTVVPLARGLEVDVEPERGLAVDADPDGFLSLLRDPETASAVLCTHRETLEGLFRILAQGRTVVPASAPPMETAAAWLLRGVVGDPSGVQLRYLPAQRMAAYAGELPVQSVRGTAAAYAAEPAVQPVHGTAAAHAGGTATAYAGELPVQPVHGTAAAYAASRPFSP